MTGRPRKQGKRERNGQPQRESGSQIITQAGAIRCREMGWNPTHANIKRAALQRYGTVQGKLEGMGLLTPDQASAADVYQTRDAANRGIRGLPRATVSAANVSGDGSGTREEPEDAKIWAVRSSYEDVQRVVKDAKAEVVMMSAIVRQDMPEGCDVPRLARCLDEIDRKIVRAVDRRKFA